MEGYIFESIIGIFVAGLTWGFRSWSASIKDSTNIIISKLEKMTESIHRHRVENTEAFARLDERVKALENQNNAS